MYFPNLWGEWIEKGSSQDQSVYDKETQYDPFKIQEILLQQNS